MYKHIFRCLFLQPHLSILYYWSRVEKNMGGEVNFDNIIGSSTNINEQIKLKNIVLLISCRLLALEWSISFMLQKTCASFIGV